jgi:GR25 family glycosyltransferase involved in LPS biosynthesis
MTLPIEKLYLKVINLPHRADRRQECLTELSRIGLPADDGIFFCARSEPEFGALGCALSHAKVLADFLFQSDLPFALIFEDDFSIRDAPTFISTIAEFCTRDFLWDVFLLGHNSAVPIEPTHFENAVRVVNSQTASGYLVGRLYAIKLIDYFFRSAELLRRYQYLPEPNRTITRSFFSCDILWKELQVKDRFVIALPSLIIQRPSYSDIEKRVVNYGV